MTVIDNYFKKLEPIKRSPLERIRELARHIVPDAEETIMYAMPTLKLHGKPFLGFDAHKNHIGLYPYSGEVTKLLKDKLAPYKFSSGAIQIPYDNPISESLLKEIISCRLQQLHML